MRSLLQTGTPPCVSKCETLKTDKKMKKILSLICLLMGATTLFAQQLPNVSVENLDGKIVSLRSLVNGKPMIISYWSIACKPCIQELNAINDALEDWRKEADFTVVAVSTDDARL